MIGEHRQAVTSRALDRPNHIRCKLNAAAHLLSGQDIWIPGRAYPGCSPSRVSRFLQVGHSARTLLCSPKNKILLTGDRLACLSGEAKYFTDRIFRRSLGLLVLGQPFFVLTGVNPSEKIAELTGCDTVPRPELALTSHCSVVIRAHWRGIPAVLHYGVCEAALAEIERQVQGLRVAGVHSRIRHLVPKIVAYNLKKTATSVQTRLPGEIAEFSWPHIDVAIELWLSHLSRSIGRANLAQVIEFIDFSAIRDEIAPVCDALVEWHETTQMPGGLTHGDFWLGNMLFEGMTPTGIIDWEWVQTDGFQAADALHMLLMSYAIAHEGNIGHFLRRLWEDDIADIELSRRVNNLRAQLGLDPQDLKFIGLALWFEYLHQIAIRGRISNEVLSAEMIAVSVPVIRRWLKSCTTRSRVSASRT